MQSQLLAVEDEVRSNCAEELAAGLVGSFLIRLRGTCPKGENALDRLAPALGCGSGFLEGLGERFFFGEESDAFSPMLLVADLLQQVKAVEPSEPAFDFGERGLDRGLLGDCGRAFLLGPVVKVANHPRQDALRHGEPNKGLTHLGVDVGLGGEPMRALGSRIAAGKVTGAAVVDVTSTVALDVEFTGDAIATRPAPDQAGIEKPVPLRPVPIGSVQKVLNLLECLLADYGLVVALPELPAVGHDSAVERIGQHLVEARDRERHLATLRRLPGGQAPSSGHFDKVRDRAGARDELLPQPLDQTEPRLVRHRDAGAAHLAVLHVDHPSPLGAGLLVSERHHARSESTLEYLSRSTFDVLRQVVHVLLGNAELERQVEQVVRTVPI